MMKHEVQELIGKTPQGLTPDEFLVALANKVQEWEREMCARDCEDFEFGYGADEYRKDFANAIRNVDR